MLNLKRIVSIGLPVLALAIAGRFYVQPVRAASTSGRNLTATVAQLGIGLVVVDQQSGAIDFCADYITSAPIGHCAKLGHIAPNASLPTPPTGLSLIIPSAANVASNATDGASAYVVNNQTGDIVQCNTINGNGTPEGTCADLGTAPQ